MASSIQLLRSTNPQERPFAGNLLEGQPAANLHSSEPGLFFKTTDGSVVKFGPAAITSDGSPPNSAPQGSSGNSVGELWLDKSVDPAVLKVYDGVDWIDAGSGGGGGGGGTGAFVRWVYTSIGGETSLSGTSGGVLLDYTPGLEEVYVNGVLITRGVDYSAINGSSITNLAALTAGDVVTVLSMNPIETVQLPGQVSLLRWTILATAGQTVLSGIDSSSQQLAYTAGFEEVYVNGAFLRRGVDYTATNGSTITMSAPLALNDEVTVLAWTPFVVNGLVTNVDVANDAAIQSSKLSFTQAGAGAVPRTVESKLREEVTPEDFGAVGDGVTDDTAALTAAFATGKIVNGNGKSYKVTPNTVIDTFATSGVGYGPNKAWFLAGVCHDITFVGNVSFGYGGYFLGKHQRVENVVINGDARLSSWYTTWQGVLVAGTVYINGDYPPIANFFGCYYNTYVNCDFGPTVIDQRYGPFNLNTFISCQFTSFHVKNTGNAGYAPGSQPAKDFHLNTFIGCEWFTDTSQGILAPDGQLYPFVIDPAVNVGGINRFVACYMETPVRGFYGPGLEVDNLHLSGNNVQIGGGGLGYNSPITGEGGYLQRDVPHTYPAASLMVGGDWSILDQTGAPPCFDVTGGVSKSLGTDAQEPTGLGKYVQFNAAAGFNSVSLKFGTADTSNRTLRSFAIIYKIVSGSPVWETQAQDGSIYYGSASTVHLGNGWRMDFGHTNGLARLTSADAYTIQVSAVSAGRGAGLLTPATNQPGGRPLIDLSGGSSLFKEAFNSSGLGAYTGQRQKSMSSGSGNVNFYLVRLGDFTGRGCKVSVTFTLLSGAGGSRLWYRESLILEDGGGSLSENNLQAVADANGSLSFVLSGSDLIVRATTGIATTETGSMSINVLGYGVGSSNVVEL